MNKYKSLLITITLSFIFVTINAQTQPDVIMTVQGPVPANNISVALVHEHVLADFIGAAKTSADRYDSNEVFTKALPYLIDLKKAGCTTFMDCTPAYFGRDVRLLKKLSAASGLIIITNTGYYGAFNEKFLPPQTYTETAEQLAARWVSEWRHGIDGTAIRPGFIKTSVDEGSLRPIYRKLLTAAALTHLQTGLTISAHTGDGTAALEEIAILQKNGVHPSAFRWVHAQNEKDRTLYLRAAHMGAWIELDGINDTQAGSIEQHVALVKYMKENGCLGNVLISQDAGWYWVGEPNGGTFRPYTALFTKFLPALKAQGITDDDIGQLLIENPRRSFAIRVRKL